MYNTQWRKEDELRVLLLDCLYIIDGRENSDHPQHGLYTGLWVKALQIGHEQIKSEGQLHLADA